MDSFLPMASFQLPFQRRLSRLYNDTKKSTDFVKGPVPSEDDPEIKGLHRKLRIQKDRLVTWGLEWSDPNQAAEIDESLSKAGLSEVVGSIMSTIKDILAEAEPLWLSSKRVVEGNPASPDRKPPLIQWDKGRFEDLVRDLTASIDTLYDLSRTRSSSAVPRRMSKAAHKGSLAGDEFRPFESSRMQTPQHIDAQTLTHLRPMKRDDGQPPLREVVFMSKTAYSELTQGTTREPWAPLLLEYAAFDSIYATTGIMPPMARFEKLSAGLQQDPQRAPGTWTGLPRLLGYFEDMENSRLGLVYRFPPSFNAVSFERLTQNPLYNLPTLNDLLSRPDSEPLLECKFRLAYNLTNTIFDMHARGVTHGNLSDRNVSFCDATTKEAGAADGMVDVRRPLVSSFDLFAEGDSVVDFSLWRHPLDPRSAPTSPLTNTDDRVLELYSLAMILLSIGLWTKIETIAPEVASASVGNPLFDRLAVKCGSLYMKAVQACWQATDEEASGNAGGESLLSAVQVRVSRYLETCCILDGVGGLEERLTQELHRDGSDSRQPVESSKDKGPKPPLNFASDVKVAMQEPAVPKKAHELALGDVDVDDALGKAAKSETKVRLYPHVALAPDVIEKWNTLLMPQVNQALRHFYRKHPESVEISLESVGTSPQKTQPTVLVVCTSVGKVRAILKKRLGDLFDGTTGFALKVCRGHVLRSRRQTNPVKRSMAGTCLGDSNRPDAEDEDVEAVNPEYQEQPGNGASIGAWIGDRHLPPVSFGGLVIVDDKPYGMTVHHMLDDPDRDLAQADNLRSSAMPDRDWYAEFASGSSGEEDFSYELSDTESEPYSETDITSDYGDDEDEDEFEPGDIPGVEPGCGDGYIVTQPALDDVEDGFYPCAETADEDHLDSFSLGQVFASSGIRRKQVNGLVHEVDWALFEFADGRLPEDNRIPSASQATLKRRAHSGKKDGVTLLRPTTVAPFSSLPGMEVQCMARTSGLQTGQILPALTSVKIYGRTSPSHTYQIASVPSTTAEGEANCDSGIPMGIPGDSGAWVVERHQGQLCGHVLAWSQRKHVAYICPMDVLLLDVAQTLEAAEVKLPGGEPIVTLASLDELSSSKGQAVANDDEDLDKFDAEEEDDRLPPLFDTAATEGHSPTASSSSIHSFSRSNQGSSSPMRPDASSELRGLASRLDDLSIGRTRRIGIN